ncbi:uncharacterized protein LOC142226383 isoform X2 [Haematobia irritans]|uniref:uncharacterized protein LOC142226383 isoform X2 n=1 Tax=Haematobia irritans TaxID=7368 RepID=UPI003F4FA569
MFNSSFNKNRPISRGDNGHWGYIGNRRSNGSNRPLENQKFWINQELASRNSNNGSDNSHGIAGPYSDRNYDDNANHYDSEERSNNFGYSRYENRMDDRFHNGGRDDNFDMNSAMGGRISVFDRLDNGPRMENRQYERNSSVENSIFGNLMSRGNTSYGGQSWMEHHLDDHNFGNRGNNSFDMSDDTRQNNVSYRNQRLSGGFNGNTEMPQMDYMKHGSSPLGRSRNSLPNDQFDMGNTLQNNLRKSFTGYNDERLDDGYGMANPSIRKPPSNIQANLIGGYNRVNEDGAYNAESFADIEYGNRYNNQISEEMGNSRRWSMLEKYEENRSESRSGYDSYKDEPEYHRQRHSNPTGRGCKPNSIPKRSLDRKDEKGGTSKKAKMFTDDEGNDCDNAEDKILYPGDQVVIAKKVHREFDVFDWDNLIRKKIKKTNPPFLNPILRDASYRNCSLVKSYPTGPTKRDPSNYWRRWWAHYAYVEKSVDKVNKDDEYIRHKMQFRVGSAKTWQECHRIISKFGEDCKKRIDQITEDSYKTDDHFKFIKFRAILRDVYLNFRRYVSTIRRHSIRRDLFLINDRVKLVLVLQNIIYRWHHWKDIVTKFERAEISLSDEVTYAYSILSCKLFNFIVSESIKELKKICADDWPEFNLYYNCLIKQHNN